MATKIYTEEEKKVLKYFKAESFRSIKHSKWEDLIIDMANELSEEFLEKYENHISWATVFRHRNNTIEFIEKHYDPSDYMHTRHICSYQKLTEDFMEKYQNQLDWHQICCSQVLPESFIEKLLNSNVLGLRRNCIYWRAICQCQHLSSKFMTKYQNLLAWYLISRYQTLTEDFITKFKKKISWDNISSYQRLSEKFIHKFRRKVKWNMISSYQPMSEKFIIKHRKRLDLDRVVTSRKISKPLQDKWVEKEFINSAALCYYRNVFTEKSIEQKAKEIQAYALKYDLKFDGEYLYAFRDHDTRGCGKYNQAIHYESGKYYRDWHCDMDKTEPNSFGLGIWPKGNTPIKVRVNDWGVAVIGGAKFPRNRGDGKGRVWGFEVL